MSYLIRDRILERPMIEWGREVPRYSYVDYTIDICYSLARSDSWGPCCRAQCRLSLPRFQMMNRERDNCSNAIFIKVWDAEDEQLYNKRRIGNLVDTEPLSLRLLVWLFARLYMGGSCHRRFDERACFQEVSCGSPIVVGTPGCISISRSKIWLPVLRFGVAEQIPVLMVNYRGHWGLDKSKRLAC